MTQKEAAAALAQNLVLTKPWLMKLLPGRADITVITAISADPAKRGQDTTWGS